MDLASSLSTDGFLSVSSDPNFLIPPSFYPSESQPTKQKGLFQSSLSKHGRSIAVEENDEYWTRLKTARSASHSLFPDGEQMLSFSSWKPDSLELNNHWNLPCFNHPSSSSSSSAYPTFRNAGVSSFTTSQWLELEQQALIYKYIDAKMAIPSNLLMPIKRSISPTGLHSFIAGSYRPEGTCKPLFFQNTGC